MSEFTGEQKLRIVLESLLRDVPKKDQCKKYGISESEFDAWNDKLIKDGGTIYETSSQESFPSSRSEGSRWSKSVLIVSVLMNLLLVAGVVGWYFFFNPHAESSEYLSNENSNLAEGPDSILPIPEKYDQVNPSPELDATQQNWLARSDSLGMFTTVSMLFMYWMRVCIWWKMKMVAKVFLTLQPLSLSQ